MKIVYAVLLLLLSTTLISQKTERADRGGEKQMTFNIIGQVVESSSGQTIDYATVRVMDANTEEVITGTTTSDGGKFVLNSPLKNVYLEISFIGYTTQRIQDISFIDGYANLDRISLGEDSRELDEVIVTAEKSSTEFKLDKRVFNVGRDLSTTGASALEVLNNVPSVNVSIEGEVTLRGNSGVQILINGKPSVLADEASGALGSITADMLESIEVITNPSAKYEAEGTSGIINLVLKKNEKKGLNGSVSVNTGWPHNHSVGLSMNKRTQDFNLFTQLGIGYKELPQDVDNENIDRNTNTTVQSTGEEFRNEKFYNIILGTDYYINPLNIITLSGRFAYEVEKQPSQTEFTSIANTNDISRIWQREETTEATNPKLQYELQYKRDFEDHKEHKLLFSAIGNFFGKDQSSIFDETTVIGQDSPTNQTTETEFQEGKYTFNLDYTKPFAEHWTIETGAQYVDNNVSNDYTVSDEVNGEYVVDDGLTNLFEYDQKVFGIYATGSFEGEVWGIKLGLRTENTDLSTTLANTGERNNQNFTNLFPSAHTSYKLSESISLQAGYSRRVYRPRLWDLNPFFNIRNNFTIRTGNPNLQPEFTDSYEVGSIFIYNKISFNINAYHRYTTEVIERVTTFEENVNVFTPENIGTNNTTGIEVNFKYSVNRKVTFNGDVNYNLFTRQGDFNDQIFDFSSDQYSGKLTSKVKLNKSVEFELTGQYQSEVQTIQGNNADNLFADFGIRYKILNGKAVFNFSVRDIFASRIRESISESQEFYAYSLRQRGRFMTLGFSYGFGKGEAMQYGGGGSRRR